MSKKHLIPLRYALLAVLTGCSLIDEDMRDCESDHVLDYRLSLSITLTTELQTQISTQTELSAVASALQAHLSAMFTDYARDVNLSFYDVSGDNDLLHNETHEMDASQHSYTLYIPVRRYMHLALANIRRTAPGEGLDMELKDSLRSHTSTLEISAEAVKDGSKNIIKSQNTGIFSARLPMDIKEGENRQFEVEMYMVNCASALALDTLGSGVRDIKVYASGFANGFRICDSTYVRSVNYSVEADEVKVDDGRFASYCAVNLPSRDPDTKADAPLWDYTIYATCQDGSVTRTVLGVTVPLEAGGFKLIRSKMEADGSVVPRESYVGASVTLNWSEGASWVVDF